MSFLPTLGVHPEAEDVSKEFSERGRGCRRHSEKFAPLYRLICYKTVHKSFG